MMWRRFTKPYRGKNAFSDRSPLRVLHDSQAGRTFSGQVTAESKRSDMISRQGPAG